MGNGKVLLPPELCMVLPKQRKGRLDDTQTAGMIRFAAQRPGDKLSQLRRNAQKVCVVCFVYFNTSINSSLMRILSYI